MGHFGTAAFSIFVLLLGSSACERAPLSPSEDVVVTRLRTEPVSLTYSSGLTTPARVVVRDQAHWREMWSSIWRLQTPEPALPSVDFSREMIVVAAMGERPTGGHSIFIESGSERSNRLTIRIRSVSPGSGCAVTLAVTYPVDVSRVARHDGPVAYDERTDMQICR